MMGIVEEGLRDTVVKVAIMVISFGNMVGIVYSKVILTEN